MKRRRTPLCTFWKRENRFQDSEPRPCRAARAILGEGCTRALASLRVGGRQVSGWGRSFLVAGGREGRGVDLCEASPPGGAERRRRGPRRCGGGQAGGATGGGGGGAALAAATRLPGPGRRHLPRPGTHGAHPLSKQCSEAPRGAAGYSATGGEAGGARPRGEPAAPSPKSASFCLAEVAAEGNSGGARRLQSWRPPLASPGLTGSAWGWLEHPDRVRPRLHPRWWHRAPKIREPAGFVRFIRESRFFEWGNFPPSSGRGIDCSAGLAGLAALFGAGDRGALGIAIVETAFPWPLGLSKEQRGRVRPGVLD